MSFEELYRRYYPDVYRFALFLTGDPFRAEDLAADTFVRAWSARGRIRQPTVRAYLLTITRNLHRDELRKRLAGPVEVPLERPILDRRAPVDVQADAAAEVRSVRERLRRVAAGDRRALLLYSMRELPYRDIARLLGITVGAVKSRIFRARDALLGDRS